MSVPRPIVLLILDGYGSRAEKADNAILLAKTPEIDALRAAYPSSTIGTSGAGRNYPDLETAAPYVVVHLTR